ncbi:MAG: peptidoglycan D,D-transpeptidase FtsI family protein [Actinomycetota bacterium]
MERQIRRVGIGLVIALIAVFAQLNYLQIFAAKRIAANPANIRRLIQEYSVKRGEIITADGETVAESKATGGRFKYQRIYPGGDLYAHTVGFYSLVYGSEGIERSFNDQLLGESRVLSMQDIEDRFLGGGSDGDDVVLTIDSVLQQAAKEALGEERGAIVALDPASGAVRALYSNPSYDPNKLASHDGREVRAFRRTLRPESPDSPLKNLATSQGYPPGSTFKVVTGSAALESGRYTPRSVFPDPVELELPLTNQTLMNFTKSSCAGGVEINLFEAMRVSCDTTFAILGLEVPNEVFETAEAYGFNERIPFDVVTQPSTFPDVPDEAEPLRAYAAIGQGDTVSTPLQMALVAAAVANDGEVPRPRLVSEVIDPSGEVAETYPKEVLGRAILPETAAQIKEMMVAVVASGTGTAAAIPGVEVAGKTGTAQTGVEGENPHTWFICFAPASRPRLAVAVIVENGGSFGSEATGGAVAAPLAKRILEVDRSIRRW